MQPGRERRLVTTALVFGIVLAAVEATAISAAMPTAVSELGGVERYSWVFTAYLLTSTASMPLYGKLADLYGRRRIYQVGIGLFLLGGALCGLAPTMTLLIVFRAVQGLGAGGLMPITATIAADIYTLEERGRVQGAFAATWAVSGLAGPLIGGLITDTLSWRFIFYLTIPAGLASMWLVGRYLRESVGRREHALDVVGTLSLTIATVLLLWALTEGGGAHGFMAPATLAMLGGAALGLVLFLWQENRAPEPILPLGLFRHRIIWVSSVGNALLGMLLFGLTTYVPVFGQGVLGGTAIDAGVLLIPLSIGWTSSSTIGGRLLMRFSYRAFLLTGGVCVALGTGFMAVLGGAAASRLTVMASLLVVGVGMGCLSLPYLLGVQNAVPPKQRGVATSSVQFFRSIGGAIAVAALGGLLYARQVAVLATEPGLGVGDIERALDPQARSALDPSVLETLRGALVHGLDGVFTAMALVAAAVLLISFAFPRGGAASLAFGAEKSPPPQG